MENKKCVGRFMRVYISSYVYVGTVCTDAGMKTRNSNKDFCTRHRHSVASYLQYST